ncbi:MAG: NeuD/PglB/VioB family sugar acetyltransferase [Bacteroidales bacterium]|nr:NeuD/PglB/VioB family sugar acetyltransferase [Bacteroidales bacterium]
MKELVIIGAGGFGREVYNLALETNDYGSKFIIKGFLDDNKNALDSFENYKPIIGSVNDYGIESNDVFVCAMGNVVQKEKCVTMIKKKGGEFISLIHPTAHIGINTEIGVGSIVCFNACISCDVTIGNFVSIQPFAALGHDVKVGDWCHLNAYAFLGGRVEVLERATIHTGAIVVPQKKVAEESIVGANSVVIRNVKKGKTVFGIPADYIEF